MQVFMYFCAVENSATPTVKGRFAPSPTGRMHLGNVFAALLSWLSARSAGGSWLLRIEDLDPQRSRREYARLIEDDLHWLGLVPDEGGLDDTAGPAAPYCQSMRTHLYADALRRLTGTGRLYGCTCTRADIMATQAPHQSDGRVVYPGRCRPAVMPRPFEAPDAPHALRLWVPADCAITFTDRLYGPQISHPARECGDFILRRADGAWAYQLAVVVDDALMGVTEVVRGADLLLSAAQQIYLYNLLGLPAPAFGHVPLLVNAEGRRLSKRDAALSMGAMRAAGATPREIIGRLGALAGLVPPGTQCTAAELLPFFAWSKLPRTATITV